MHALSAVEDKARERLKACEVRSKVLSGVKQRCVKTTVLLRLRGFTDDRCV